MVFNTQPFQLIPNKSLLPLVLFQINELPLSMVDVLLEKKCNIFFQHDGMIHILVTKLLLT